MSRKLFLAAGLIISSFLFTSCNSSIKNDKVYFIDDDNTEQNTITLSTPLSTDGINPFHKLPFDISEIKNHELLIPITLSPDNQTAFIMERTQDKNERKIIKGEPKESINLIKYDFKTKNKETIAENIYFITNAKWNSQSTMVAFSGGGQFRIYDIIKGKFINQEDLRFKEVVNFGWSPDGRKLYIEQNTLVNDSIIYPENGKLVNSYETGEEQYYKASLDYNNYYCTVSNQSRSGLTTTTVIVNDKGEKIKDLPQGRYADSFKRSLLLFGERKEGLYYIPDINKPKNIKTLSKEIVYDTKFTAGGNIVFTTKINDVEKNSFILHVVDFNGTEIHSSEVSGPEIAVSLDGKLAYIGGPNEEILDLVSLKLEGYHTNLKEEEKEYEAIFKVIRGGMRTYNNFKTNEENDTIGARRYFIDTNSPEQWAYFDLQTMWNKNLSEVIPKSEYISDIFLKSVKVYSDGGYNRASLVIEEDLEANNRSLNTYALEMVKISDRWFITGLSTFPYTDETRRVSSIVQDYVEEARNGTIFDGELKGKQIKVGQIQFWDMSEGKLAPDIKTADGCKVFLTVSEKNSQVTYKLILSKGYDNKWRASMLRKDRLNYFN